MSEEKKGRLVKKECLRIKRLLEKISKIEDIGARSRKGAIPEMKKFYVSLCKEFTTASLVQSGEVLGNYKHATMIHNNKKFKHLFDAPNGFDYRIFYDKAYLVLDQERNDRLYGIKPRHTKKIKEIKHECGIKIWMMSQKYHSIINRQREEIKQLKHQALRNIEVDLQAV